MARRLLEGEIVKPLAILLCVVVAGCATNPLTGGSVGRFRESVTDAETGDVTVTEFCVAAAPSIFGRRLDEASEIEYEIRPDRTWVIRFRNTSGEADNEEQVKGVKAIGQLLKQIVKGVMAATVGPGVEIGDDESESETD